MPAWNSKTQDWIAQGKLVVVGIAQEQHLDRCRLFTQWQNMDWPILHDPINVMQVRGVPMFTFAAMSAVFYVVIRAGVDKENSPYLSTQSEPSDYF